VVALPVDKKKNTKTPAESKAYIVKGNEETDEEFFVMVFT